MHKKKPTPPAPVISIGDGAAIPHPSDKGLSSAWRFSICAAIILIFYLYFFQPDPYRAIFHFILPDGLYVTFKVTIGGISLALVIGLITGLGRLSRWRPFYFLNSLRILERLAKSKAFTFRLLVNGLRRLSQFMPFYFLASTYVEIVRGIPLMVQLFYIYYALAKYLQVPGTVAAIIAMGFCYGAYMGETFRAGIESIDFGQKEAALSLGYSPARTMRYVIIPQALRTILPPIGNEFISLLKDSTLVSVVAVPDLMRLAKEHSSTHFDFFETYTMVALIYLVLTLLLSKMVSLLEGCFGDYAKR